MIRHNIVTKLANLTILYILADVGELRTGVIFVMDLFLIFENINNDHFDGFLDPPALKWNAHLSKCAGRFIPGVRKHINEMPPQIEVARYLLQKKEAQALVRDTVAHEMIHYWLWLRRRPHGHTEEFLTKMNHMGVSRYNPVPKKRIANVIYWCSNCKKQFPATRKTGTLACAECCNKFANGNYDERFKLMV